VWGHNVDESFYAQHQLEALQLQHSILEELLTCGSGKTELELRSLLGCFLFSGDETDKKIRVLSGGEKARVALAKVIASKANFLLLDEPTNHLDMHSVELLAESLNKYEGTYILVSHDRYFISKTANKIWEIVDHEIKEFKGTYTEWVEWKQRQQKAAEQAAKENKATTPTPAPAAPAPVAAPAKTGKPINKELQKLQRQFAKLEEQLNAAKTKQTEIELELSKPENYANKDSFTKLEQAYAQSKAEVSKLEADYEKLFEQIVEAEGN
jgi:ATP-binding cassette subfamily F protein 3